MHCIYSSCTAVVGNLYCGTLSIFFLLATHYTFIYIRIYLTCMYCTSMSYWDMHTQSRMYRHGLACYPAHCSNCAGEGNRKKFFAHAQVSWQPGSRTLRLYSTHHTEAGALKHTHTHKGRRTEAKTHTGKRTQAHTNTEAGALKHTHTHREAYSSTHTNTEKRTQAHTRTQRQAHSSTYTHTPTDTCTCTYHRQNRYLYQLGEHADTGTHSPYACTLKHMYTHVHRTCVLHILSTMHRGCVCWGTCALQDRNLAHGDHMWDGGREWGRD